MHGWSLPGSWFADVTLRYSAQAARNQKCVQIRIYVVVGNVTVPPGRARVW
jgi:hypothetical protein